MRGRMSAEKNILPNPGSSSEGNMPRRTLGSAFLVLDSVHEDRYCGVHFTDHAAAHAFRCVGAGAVQRSLRIGNRGL